MPTFEALSWWREHGEHFAHVDPIPGGGWLISLWYGSTCIKEGARRFARLTAAKAAADDLVRRRPASSM